MKYTVEGFNQKGLIKLGLSLEETLLLRWFVDFQGQSKMKVVHNEGKVFFWVNYQSAADDLPIIASNKYKVARLFESMIKKGLFERYTYKVGGVYSTFRLISETYMSLIEDTPSSSFARTLQADLLEPSSSFASTNNSSTKDESIIKRSKKSYQKRKVIDKGEYKQYGEHGKVFFYDSEYEKLVKEHSEEIINTAIDIVDNYLYKNQDKSYTDFVRVFNKWAIEEAEKKVKQSSFQNSYISSRTNIAPLPEIMCCGKKYDFNVGFCTVCGKKYNREGKVC